MGSQPDECGNLIDKIAKTMAFLHSNECRWSQQTVEDTKSWWSQVAELALKADTFPNRFWLHSLWAGNQSNIKERFRNYLTPSLTSILKESEQKNTHGSLSSKSRIKMPIHTNSHFLDRAASTCTKSNVKPLSLCSSSNKNESSVVHNDNNRNNNNNRDSKVDNSHMYNNSSSSSFVHRVYTNSNMYTGPLNTKFKDNNSYSFNDSKQLYNPSPEHHLNKKDRALTTTETENNSPSSFNSLWMYEEEKENDRISECDFPESPFMLVNSNEISPAKSSPSYDTDFLINPGSQFEDNTSLSQTKILATGSGIKSNKPTEPKTAASLLFLSPSLPRTSGLDIQNENDDANLHSTASTSSDSNAQRSKTTVPIPVVNKFWSLDAKALLESQDPTKLSTTANFERITEQTVIKFVGVKARAVFLFDTNGAKEPYWLNDGEDWLQGKAQAQPWRKGKAIIQARTYILRRNGLKLPIRKCEYWCLHGETDNWDSWRIKRVVIQYNGNFGAFHFPKLSIYLKSSSQTEADKNGPVYTGIPQVPTKTPKSTFLMMEREIKNGCRGKRLHDKLTLDSNRRKIKGEPDLHVKNTKQIYNQENKLKRKKPIFRDDIGDISAMAEEFPAIFPKIEIGYRKIIVMSHPELHKHLNEFHKLAKAYIFSYDTTFNLGPFFVSVLSVRHPAFNENPAIPVSVMFHTYQDSDDTHVSMFKATKMSLTCFDHSKNLLITDREKGITKAISNELTKLHNSFCYNHIRQNVLRWTTKHYRHDKVYARVLQLDVKRLLWASTEKEYENYISSRCDSDDFDPYCSDDDDDQIEVDLPEGTKMDIGQDEERELQKHIAPWDSKFKGYFYKYLDADIRQSFRGRLKKYCVFNVNSGVTNNSGESLNDVLKNHKFEPGEEKTLYTIANYIHDWQSVILLDIDKALKGESSNYTVKETFQGRLASLTEIKVPDSTLIFRDDLREPELPPKLQKVESDVNWSIKEKIAHNLVDKGKVKMKGDGFFSVQGQRQKYMVHLADKTCTCNNTRCYHRIAVGIAVGTYNHPNFEYLKQIKATTTTDTYKKSVPKRSGKKGSNVIRVPIQIEENESTGEDDETDESSMSSSSTVTPSFVCTSSENEDEYFDTTKLKKHKKSRGHQTQNKTISPGRKIHSTTSRGDPVRGGQFGSFRGRGGQSSSSKSRGGQYGSSRGRGGQSSSSRRILHPKFTSLKLLNTTSHQPQPTSSGQKTLPSEGHDSVLPSSTVQTSTTVTSQGHISPRLSSPGQKSTTTTTLSCQESTTRRSRRNQSSSVTETVALTKSNKQLPSHSSDKALQPFQNMKLPLITSENGCDPLVTIAGHHLSLRELKTLTGLTKDERQSLVESPDHYQNLIENENWITDGIIFTYLQKTKQKTTMVLSPEQATFIFTDQQSSVKSRMFNDTSGVRCGLWQSARLALVPFNVDKSHWVLLVARLKEEIVWILDPLSSWKPSVFEEIALENCLHKALGKVQENQREMWQFVQKDCVKQQNYDDCGVYILHYARVIQKSGSLMTKPKANFRLQILDELIGNCQLSHKLVNGTEKVCTKCKTSGMSKSPTAWLKCYRCSLWTHKNCDPQFNPKSMSELVYVC